MYVLCIRCDGVAIKVYFHSAPITYGVHMDDEHGEHFYELR